MKEVSENILDELYEKRYETIIRQVNRTAENQIIENTQNEIKKMIKENIKDIEIKNLILEKFELLEEYGLEENIFYEKKFYKSGFADGISFKAEMKQELEKYNKNDFKGNQ